MGRLTLGKSPFLIGFDEMEDMLERLSKASGESYPPYNIEHISAADGVTDTPTGECLRITVAVAGFSEDDLSVVVEGRQLTIRGKHANADTRTYLHRGIAARQFQRSFLLADGMEVVGARLENGLLSIDLMRPEIKSQIRNIQITRRT